MKKSRSTPLLRAATLGVMFSCGLSDSQAQDTVSPMEAVADSRLILQGTVDEPGAGQEAWIEVKTGGETKRIKLPQAGPWPRPFLLSDADLEGLDVGDTVELQVLWAEAGKPVKMSQTLALPARSTGLRLRATVRYLPPSSALVMPSPETVLEMPPAHPDEAGSKVDIQGVVVFPAAPTPRNISLRFWDEEEGSYGEISLKGPSPIQFRFQDSNLEPGQRFRSQTLKVQCIVLNADGTAEAQDLMVPAQSKGHIIAPALTRPPPPSPPRIFTQEMDFEGVVEEPDAEGDVKEVRISVYAITGWGAPVVLPPEPFPRAFHLKGGAFSHVPYVGPDSWVKVEVEMANGQVWSGSTTGPPKSAGVVLVPAELSRPATVVQPVTDPRPPKMALPQREPVYGNTKGSHYDKPERAPAPQKPKK